MNDFQRYIRYALPGIASLVPLLLAFIISDYDSTISALSNEKLFGPGLSIVLGSGGLGFFYSGVYFALYWIPGPINFWAVDHRHILQRFLIANKLQLNHLGASSIRSKRKAWERIGIVWDIAISKNSCMKQINERVERLITRLHGIGSTIVGLFFSFCIWVYVYLSILHGTLLKGLIVGGIWAIIIFAFACNYWYLKKIHQSVANKSLSYFMYYKKSIFSSVKFPIEYDDDV